MQFAGCEDFIEQLPCFADEGLANSVFVGPWSLADEDEPSVWRAYAKYSLGSQLRQIVAFCALRDFILENVESGLTLVWGAPPDQLKIRPVINAQRGQLFSSYYQAFSDDQSSLQLEEISSSQVTEFENWASSISTDDIITGPGIPDALTPEIIAKLGCKLMNQENRNCSASLVGRLAEKKHIAGERESHWKLDPIYFRPSTAEETFDRKQAEKNNRSV